MIVRWSTCGLGTAPLGSRPDGPLWWGEQDRATAVRTVRAALDHGVTWVDTAPFYGWGRAEEIVGEALAGRRDEVVLLTKCGTIRRPDGTWTEDGSPAAVRADVEASLRRLRTDHVDVVQLHDPDPDVPVEETVGALAELVADGLVGAIGLSNHPVELLTRGASAAPIAVVQHQWNLLEHSAEADAAATWSAGERRPVPGVVTAGLRASSPTASPSTPSTPTTSGGACAGRARPTPPASIGSVASPPSWISRSSGSPSAGQRGGRHPIVGARTPAETALLAGVEPLDDDTAAMLA